MRRVLPSSPSNPLASPKNVPRKHIIVYTLIRPGSQGLRVQMIGLVYFFYLVYLVQLVR